MTAPPDLREYDEKIAQVRRQKESAIDSGDFEKAAALRDTEKQLTGTKDAGVKAQKAGRMDAAAEVTAELIAEVLAAATGIPVFKLTEEKILFDELRAAQIVTVDVQGTGPEAQLTFKGVPRPDEVPDAPPAVI